VIFTTIAETGVLDDDTIAALDEVVDEVKQQFTADKKAAADAAAVEKESSRPGRQPTTRKRTKRWALSFASTGAGFARSSRPRRSLRRWSSSPRRASPRRRHGCGPRAPYAEELTRALAALGKNASLSHPLLSGGRQPAPGRHPADHQRPGLAGGYSSNVIRRAEPLADRLSAQGKEPVRFVIGRKGLAFYRFRSLDVAVRGRASPSSRRSSTPATPPRRPSARCRPRARASSAALAASTSSTSCSRHFESLATQRPTVAQSPGEGGG